MLALSTWNSWTANHQHHFSAAWDMLLRNNHIPKTVSGKWSTFWFVLWEKTLKLFGIWFSLKYGVCGRSYILKYYLLFLKYILLSARQQSNDAGRFHLVTFINHYSLLHFEWSTHSKVCKYKFEVKLDWYIIKFLIKKKKYRILGYLLLINLKHSNGLKVTAVNFFYNIWIPLP